MSIHKTGKFGAALVVLLLTLSAIPGLTQDLEIPAELRLKWTGALRENLEVLAVDPAGHEEIGRRFEALVRRFMDLDRAKKTQTNVAEDEVMYTLFSDANPAVFLGADRGTPIRNAGPVPLVFRKGKRRFSFVKFLTGPGGSPLGESEAARLSEDFLRTGGLLDDRATGEFWKTEHSQIEVVGRTGAPRIVSQQVRYYRKVGNWPVFNTGMTVRFHPGSRELLACKLANWGRLRGRAADQGRAARLASVEEYIRKLRAAGTQGKTVKPGRALTRRLTDIELGYFAIEDTLIPGFLCRVESRVMAAGTATGLDYRAFFIALNGELLPGKTASQTAAEDLPKAPDMKRRLPGSTGAALKRRKPRDQNQNESQSKKKKTS
jgi:hypothetical protein